MFWPLSINWTMKTPGVITENISPVKSMKNGKIDKPQKP